MTRVMTATGMLLLFGAVFLSMSILSVTAAAGETSFAGKSISVAPIPPVSVTPDPAPADVGPMPPIAPGPVPPMAPQPIVSGPSVDTSGRVVRSNQVSLGSTEGVAPGPGEMEPFLPAPPETGILPIFETH